MKQILYSIPLLMLMITACNENDESATYYPVDAWVNEEVELIDSLPVAIIHYKTEDGHTDTNIYSKPSFTELTKKGLLNFSFEDSKIKKQYSELVLDEGNNTNISIIYTATESSELPIRKLQLNVKPGSNKPKSLYVERNDLLNNIIIKRKILWTREKSLTITSTYFQQGKEIREIIEKFDWGF